MDAGELEKFKVRKPVADLVRSRPDFAKIRPANYLRASPILSYPGRGSKTLRQP
jgi:hypothetical protein